MLTKMPCKHKQTKKVLSTKNSRKDSFAFGGNSSCPKQQHHYTVRITNNPPTNPISSTNDGIDKSLNRACGRKSRLHAIRPEKLPTLPPPPGEWQSFHG